MLLPRKTSIHSIAMECIKINDVPGRNAERLYSQRTASQGSNSHKRGRKCPDNGTSPTSGSFQVYNISRSRTSRPLSWLVVFLGLMVGTTNAVFIKFENCLSPNKIHSEPRTLQFVPLLFWADFNTTDSSHNVNTTVYGNVTGQLTKGPYPPPDDPKWGDSKETFGKIVDVDENANKFTTLFARLNVLSYTPWSDKGSEFCKATVNTKCPVGPAFSVQSYATTIFSMVFLC